MKLQIYRAKPLEWRDDEDDYPDMTFDGISPLDGAFMESWAAAHMYYPDRQVQSSAWFIELESIGQLEELLSKSEYRLIFYPKDDSPLDWHGHVQCPGVDYALRIYDDYIE